MGDRLNMEKTKIRKPGPFRSRSLFAACHIDRDEVVMEFSDRSRWTEIGGKIPTKAEIEKFSEWVRKVRAYSRARKAK